MRPLRSLFFIILTLTTMVTRAQLRVTSGTSLTVQPGTSFTLEQEVSVAANAVLVNEGRIHFKGNFNNNGTVLSTAVARWMANGSTLQILAGSSGLQLNHFTINNSEGFSLSTPLTITDTLILANGILFSATQPVHFDVAAASPVESVQNHILGKAIMNERMIGTNELLSFLGVQTAAGADLGNISIERITGQDAVVNVNNRNSIAARWKINSSQQPNAGRDLQLAWLPVFDNGADLDALELYGDNPGYMKLSTQSQSVQPANPRIFIQENIDRFNRSFTLIDTGFFLKFLQFTGQRVPGGVQLQWLTGREHNNEGFDIERAFDGVNFLKIGFEAGKNDMVTNSYAWLDATVAGSTEKRVYYRLKQKNSDGSFQYSNTIVLNLNGIVDIKVFPNPFSDYLFIDIVKEDTQPLNLHVFTLSGTEVYSNRYSIGRTGRIDLKGLHALAAGTYIFQLQNSYFNETIKIIKHHN